MIKYTLDRLGELVEEIDSNGAVAGEFFKKLSPEFMLDVDIWNYIVEDPFSDEYIQRQLALHQEISGREVYDYSCEHTPVPSNITDGNPYGSHDSTFIAKHSKTILDVVYALDLSEGSRALDMGCGWGLSTEMLLFSGLSVTAVDVNSDFCDLVRKRNEGADLAVVNSDFESFRADDEFDLVLFYECLHHSVRPWKAISSVRRSLAKGGSIVLAGEPFFDFWPDWGLRLDLLSVYCMKKFGWFESGWTPDFLMRCFAREGLDLSLIHGLGLDGGIIGVATDGEGIGSLERASQISQRLTRVGALHDSDMHFRKSSAGFPARVKRFAKTILRSTCCKN